MPNSQPFDPRIFPQELIDYIIDFLHDDKHSLVSFGSASRSCATSCQYHLYNTLECRGCDDEESEEDSSFAYIALFFEMHKHLQTYVKDIRIVSNADDMICACVVSSVLSTLPSLHAFTVDNVRLVSDQCCLQPAPPHLHTGVLTLNLTGTRSSTVPDHILNLLRLFPAMQRVSIQAVRIHAVDDSPNETVITRELAFALPDRRSGLIQLALVGESAGMVAPFVHLFDTWNMLSEMQDLRVVCYDWDDLSPVIRIIEASTKTLNRLALDVSTIIYYEVTTVGNGPGELQPVSSKSARYCCIYLHASF